MYPRIGLVTVLYNSPEVLPGFFKSLSAQTFRNFCLYIVDNSTNEDSYNFIISQHTKLGFIFKIIRNKTNVGVAAANNQGILQSLASGVDYILLLNNDIEFDDERLLENLVQLAVKKNLKFVAPKILYYDSRLIWCAGGRISRLKGISCHRGIGKRDSEIYNYDKYVEYFPTCFMLIHCSVFEQVGLMDEKYFVYFDDTDFVWRSNNLGLRIYYWSGGSVFHKVNSSTGGGWSLFSTYYFARNRIYFARKNLPVYYRYISFLLYILTRFLYKIYYVNSDVRNSLFKGIIDGFKVKID